MTLVRLFDLLRPRVSSLAALAGLNAIGALLALTVPWLGGTILGRLVDGAQAIDRTIIAALVGVIGALTAISMAAAFVQARINASVRASLRRQLFDHVQRLPISYHDQVSKGDILALLTYESWRLGEFVTGTLAATPARLLTAIGASVVMFWIEPRLALIVPLLVPAFYLVLKIAGRQLRGLAKAQQRAEARAIQLAEEALEVLPLTKSFTREVAQSDEYRVATDAVADVSIRLDRINAVIQPLFIMASALCAIAVLLTAGDSIRAGRLDATGLLSFIFYAAMLARPVGALAHIYGEFSVARGTLERVQRVLDETPEPTGAGASAERCRGGLEFDHVRFAYPGRPELLSDLSLSIAAGEKIALIGPNGAGKSALIGLLLRFYDPASGTITLDGRDIAGFGLDELRRQIGLVPQLPYLLSGSIRDNIAFGRDGPVDDQQIVAAARLAQAHAFIEQLPLGYDTLVGDRGIRLSGGQRQRVALARALIKDPPILVLDEATSMVDFEGEAGFVGDCREAIADRTVIFITHRPALLALADRIVELKDGRIVERDPSALPDRITIRS